MISGSDTRQDIKQSVELGKELNKMKTNENGKTSYIFF